MKQLNRKTSIISILVNFEEDLMEKLETNEIVRVKKSIIKTLFIIRNTTSDMVLGQFVVLPFFGWLFLHEKRVS